MSFDEASELGRALERERALFRKFEELRNLAGQLRTILSHDIKSPLAVMIGAADLLSRDLKGLPEERSTKLLGTLLSSVKQIQSMVATGDAEAVAALVKPVSVDLVAAGRRASDIEIHGAKEISTYHPAIVDALLQHVLAPAQKLHLSSDGDWVVLTVSGTEDADAAITNHFLEMLGGRLHSTLLLLPQEPQGKSTFKLGGRDSNPQPID